MSPALMAQMQLRDLLLAPLTWGMVLAAIGVWLMLASVSPRSRLFGRLVALAGATVVAVALPKLSPLETMSQWGEQLVFWLLAGVAVGCSTAAVTARNPVYTAIWFAGSLLGVAGLFLFQSAQFLGVSTIVVYAGAIVVTFLFVLMLANPEGHARYDRISWSNFAIPTSVLAGLALIGVIVSSFRAPQQATKDTDVLTEGHMIQLGTELFSKHLLAVEVAGTLLLIALVGAVAIVIQGKQRPTTGPHASNQPLSGGNGR